MRFPNFFLCYCSTMTQLLTEYASNRSLYLMRNPLNENEYWITADEISVWLEANIFQTKETKKRRVGLQQDVDFFQKIKMLSVNADIEDFGKVICLTEQGDLTWNQIQKWIRYTIQKTNIHVMGWFIEGIHFAVWYPWKKGLIHWEAKPEIWTRNNIYEQYYSLFQNNNENSNEKILKQYHSLEQIKPIQELTQVKQEEIKEKFEENEIVKVPFKGKREMTRLEWIKLGCPPNVKIIAPVQISKVQDKGKELADPVEPTQTIVTSWEDIPYHNPFSLEYQKWWTFAQWGRIENEYFQNHITRVGAD